MIVLSAPQCDEVNKRAWLYHADCLHVLPTLPENSIDAVVTDPPYELGFMGRSWDASGVAFCPRTWEKVLRVMKPGAHLVAFGAPKNYHRLACAIEDAGFEIRDSLMWVFGSGFPKSLDVSKAIDKAAGAEREVIGRQKNWGARPEIGPNGHVGEWEITAPATDAARQWQGWGTALKPAWESIIVASKPLEFAGEIAIIGSEIRHLERKLWSILPANVAEQCFGLSQSEFGAVCASAQWSAEQRSNTLDDLRAQMDTSQFVSALISSLSTVSLWKTTLAENLSQESMSIIETELKTITDLRTLKFLLSKITPGAIILAQQIGPTSNAHALHAVRNFNAIVLRLSAILELSAVGPAISQEVENCRVVADGPNATPIVLARKPLSEGTVAANVQRWGTGAINIDATRVGDEVRMASYTSLAPCHGNALGKPGTAEARRGTQSPPKTYVGRWPANLVHDGSDEVIAGFPQSNGSGPARTLKRGTRDDGWGMSDSPGELRDAGSGSAARFFYCAKASKADRAGSKHPTVKPVSLMRWLVRMITPPNGVILDPFGGSGTTGQAAFEEGFAAVLIEREDEYATDIRRRLSRDAAPKKVRLED